MKEGRDIAAGKCAECGRPLAVYVDGTDQHGINFCTACRAEEQAMKEGRTTTAELLDPNGMLPPSCVTIDRAVLAEALELMNAAHNDYEHVDGVCPTCRTGVNHEPDCRFVRVVDALRRALGP